ncbi:tetratricopeptide repeat protein [Candidatus Poribacteria bacterium]|nr:tetratricopeptide repeat protein [Candidatus Poribacteria bacterium]MYH80568.1 tetratricopeptide repeat protein [Candidatus Poribacteria bacterium]MYK95586.1 tetratricopeptide repeat protein [Candidatus Poribacteria bacterium]
MKSILFFLFMLISLPVFAVSEISSRQSAISSELKREVVDEKPLVTDNRQLKGFFEKKSGLTTIPQPADLDLVEEKLLLDAIEAAQEAVRTSPEDADAWGHLGHVYLIHGWEAPAVPCYRQASRLAPDEFKWLYFLGRLMKERQPEAAVKSLTRALTLNAEYAPAHLYLAAALRILGKLDEARPHLEHAKRLQPNNPFSELWLGEIALARQQLKLARTHLESALRLNPKQSEAHALMAQVMIALGDKQAAKQHAQAARYASQYGELSDPLWWDVLKAGVTASLYAERGRRYMSEGDYVRAVAEFAPLITNEQKDVKVWFDYGVALLHTGRYKDAVAALESLLVLLHTDEEVQKEKEPDEIAYLKARVYNHLGQTYYATGRADAAILACQKAIQFSDNLVRKSHGTEYFEFFANVHADLAMVYESTGQLEQAILQYQKALGLMPTKPSLHQEIAGTYWKKRLYIAAEPHYKVVTANDATNLQAAYRLGLIFLIQELYEEAASQFKKVIQLDATYVRAYSGLGVAYQELGKFPEAIDAFEAVLRLEPGNRNAIEMLRQLRETK